MMIHEEIVISGERNGPIVLKIGEGDNMIQFITSDVDLDGITTDVDNTLDVCEAKQLRAALKLFIEAAEHNDTDWSDDE